MHLLIGSTHIINATKKTHRSKLENDCTFKKAPALEAYVVYPVGRVAIRAGFNFVDAWAMKENITVVCNGKKRYKNEKVKWEMSLINKEKKDFAELG